MGSEILTIDDLMNPMQILSLNDQYGRVLNIAEMLIQKRDVNGRVNIQDVTKRFFGERDFEGVLAEGVLNEGIIARARLRCSLVGPFDKMKPENTGLYVDEHIWEEGGPFPKEGDVMAVYWLSKKGRPPKTYGGRIVYVKPVGISLPFTELEAEEPKFVFRSDGSDMTKYRAELKRFIKAAREDWITYSDDNADIEKQYSIFSNYLITTEQSLQYNEMSEEQLQKKVEEEFGSSFSSFLERNKERFFLYDSFLASLLLTKNCIASKVKASEEKSTCYDRFEACCASFLLEVNSELKRMIRKKKLTFGDTDYILETAYSTALSSQYDTSVRPRFDHFGGWERRRNINN